MSAGIQCLPTGGCQASLLQDRAQDELRIEVLSEDPWFEFQLIRLPPGDIRCEIIGAKPVIQKLVTHDWAPCYSFSTSHQWIPCVAVEIAEGSLYFTFNIPIDCESVYIAAFPRLTSADLQQIWDETVPGRKPQGVYLVRETIMATRSECLMELLTLIDLPPGGGGAAIEAGIDGLFPNGTRAWTFPRKPMLLVVLMGARIHVNAGVHFAALLKGLLGESLPERKLRQLFEIKIITCAHAPGEEEACTLALRTIAAQWNITCLLELTCSGQMDSHLRPLGTYISPMAEIEGASFLGYVQKIAPQSIVSDTAASEGPTREVSCNHKYAIDAGLSMNEERHSQMVVNCQGLALGLWRLVAQSHHEDWSMIGKDMKANSWRKWFTAWEQALLSVQQQRPDLFDMLDQSLATCSFFRGELVFPPPSVIKDVTSLRRFPPTMFISPTRKVFKSTTMVAQERACMGNDGPGVRIKFVKAFLLRSLLIPHGFHQCDDSKDWVLSWSGRHIKTEDLIGMTPFQKHNHYPQSSFLTRKDRLWSSMYNASRWPNSGITTDFLPPTYIMPRDRDTFLARHANDPDFGIWIYKPSCGACGREIEIITDPAKVPDSKVSAVLQRYLNSPLLINGHKFDLRIYVLVTSYDPLRVYMFNNGLARFAAELYDPDVSSLGNLSRHLTNVSFNKGHPEFEANTSADRDNVGTVWSLRACKAKLREMGVDVVALFEKIEDLTIKSLMSVQPIIGTRLREARVQPGNCFELYGFDVFVDNNLKPWLLETNAFPSIICGTPMDLEIKSNLVANVLTIAGLVPAHLQPPNTHAPPTADDDGYGALLCELERASLSARRLGLHTLSGLEEWERESAKGSKRKYGFRCIYPRPDMARYDSCAHHPSYLYPPDTAMRLFGENGPLAAERAGNAV